MNYSTSVSLAANGKVTGDVPLAYRLVDEKYQVAFAVEWRAEKGLYKASIPPFELIEIDLHSVFGGEE